MQTLELAGGLSAVTGMPWPGVQYFCTWRTGGVSQAPRDSLNLGLHVGDAPEAVLENRARLQRALPDAPLWLTQVHGTTVCDDDRVVDSTGRIEADAAVTTRRCRPLAILTADCLPVVLADAAGSVLGVAHAGWRGLAAGVLENTLARMRRQAPLARGWRAWIGPGIGPSAFEVGDEVRAAFLRIDAGLAVHFTRSPAGRWLADLAGLAQSRLRRAGVEQVESSGECTYLQADRYFSYRRAHPTGRQASLAWLV